MAGSGLTGFLQNFGGGELIVILLVALVVLGPERLPEMARSAGRGLHKLRTMTEGLTSDMKEVIDDPAMQPLRELGELAARPRQKLAEYALEAEAEERAKAERAALDGAADTDADTDTVAGDDAGDAPVHASPGTSDSSPTDPPPAEPEAADPGNPAAPVDPVDPGDPVGAPGPVNGGTSGVNPPVPAPVPPCGEPGGPTEGAA
jgi:sec-independent protein translocase protein TatB